MKEPAIPFPDSLQWCNVARGPSLTDDLRGHVVVVLFFTSSCVHSRRSLRDLRALEQRFFGDPVVFLGVHSPRLPSEGGREAVESSLRRLGVQFPVAIDDDLACWDAWSVHVWPTLAVIDPAGDLVFQGGGQLERHRLARRIETLVQEASGEEEGAGLPVRVPPPESTASALRFPTAVLVDTERGLVWTSDTGNHRVLGIDRNTGKVKHVVGLGLPGHVDGAGPDAALCEPQGLAVHADVLWIADSGNHALRTYDPATGIVETFLGNGRPIQDCLGGYCGADQGLHSPWGLTVWEDPARGPSLLLTQAAGHQIWLVDTDTRVATALVGTGGMGAEDDRDDHASLAQPEGIAAVGDVAVWADAGSSSVRIYEGGPRETRTLVGQGLHGSGTDLGDREHTQLQAPAAVAWRGEDVVILDRGNGRVLSVSEEGPVTVLAEDVGGAQGLDVAGEELFVVDTERHRVLRGAVGQTLTPWSLPELPRPHPASTEISVSAEVAPEGGVMVRAHLALPPAHQIDSETSVIVILTSDDASVLAEPVVHRGATVGQLVVVPDVPLGAEGGVMRVEARFLVVREQEAPPQRMIQRWRVDVARVEGGDAAIDLRC